MFDRFTGVAPEEAVRWTAMVDLCRPVFARVGMIV